MKYKLAFFPILTAFSYSKEPTNETTSRNKCKTDQMFKRILLTLLLGTAFKLGFAQQQPARKQDQASGFSNVEVKKKVAGKVCDTCGVEFALSAEPVFSYILTGSEHTPRRFYTNLSKIKNAYLSSENTSIQLISNRFIGITFLPNFMMKNGKRTQLYRKFQGEDYNKLEFSAIQRHTVIKDWTPLADLKQNKDHVFLGSKNLADDSVTKSRYPTFFAGNFSLAIGDTLELMVRNIASRKVIKTIMVIRPEDKANNFIFYQLPLEGEALSTNLQHILNYGSGVPKVYKGTEQNTFEKDYGTLGILRFGTLGKNEELQYAFENKLGSWHSVQSIGPENTVYIVLENDLPAGTKRNIFLRYKSQPETVHQITVKVKQSPFQIPWGKVALISMVLLLTGGVAFYLWNRRSKRKLAALKRKAEDTEARLALLSGQLNPHFLFNSLNSIQGTINSNNPRKASTYIGNVAAFMRDVMDNGKKEFISLQEEIKMEEDYLRLEQERIAFSYSIDVSPDLSAPLIDFPPLILQPVLENSIRHAFGKQPGSPCISIRIFSSGTSLIVEASDNGNNSWEHTAAIEGHGLSLIRKRIAVYNEKLESLPIQMEVKYQAGTGTITTFTFQNWL